MPTVATHSHRQAIITKYHGPSDVKGSRVSAQCDAGRIYLHWDDALNSDENHAAACEAMLKRVGWTDVNYVGAYAASIDAHVWVDDTGRLEALRGFVNDYRKASWSGNPWCKGPFITAVRVIGAAFGFHGEPTSAPTTDDEVKAYRAR